MVKKTEGASVPDPVMTPEVATKTDPTNHAVMALPGDAPSAGEGLLQEALPAVSEAARKVGGFRRLSEIAGQLDKDGTGQ